MSESINNNLRRFKATFTGPSSHLAFLMMFIGVVVGPLMLFVIGGHGLSPSGQSILFPITLIALLLIISIGGGFLLFRQSAYIGKYLSIGPNRD